MVGGRVLRQTGESAPKCLCRRLVTEDDPVVGQCIPPAGIHVAQARIPFAAVNAMMGANTWRYGDKNRVGYCSRPDFFEGTTDHD